MSRARGLAAGRGLLALCVAASLQPGRAWGQTAGGGHDTVWNFSGVTDGLSPRGDVLIDSAGDIFGTTSSGGVSGDGTVFEATVPAGGKGSGTATGIYDFTGGADGSVPNAGLIMDAAGALFGTASQDGAGQGGTIFQLTPPVAGQSAWTETTLWSFGTGADGRNPMGAIVADANGALYGTTSFGGVYGQGTVFMLTPPGATGGVWSETLLWSFTGGADGAQPVAGLVFDSSGALLGTAKAGGASGAGAVFRIAPDGKGGWTETTLWGFKGGADGAAPSGTLLPDGSGGFYGTAEFGGIQTGNCDQARYPYYFEPNSETEYAANAAYIPPGGNGCGVVFHLSPPRTGGAAWTETLEWSFTGGVDGANPSAGVAAGVNGTLYGLTTQYGQEFWGTEYSLVPATAAGQGQLTTLVFFNGKDEGFYPRGTPVLGPGGRLFGTTSVGGKTWVHISNYGYGTLFSTAP